MVASRANAAIFAAVVVCFAAVIFQSSYISATQANADGQVPTFRSESRMVLIDVLVTDRHGNPVLGLKPQDFTLTDDGTRQSLSGFEEHQKATPNNRPPLFVPDKNAVTNWIAPPATGAVNIIVFDTLNTTVVDKMRARQQMLKCLSTLPPGQQVALFTLGTSLRMVQDFTTNSGVLIAAARKISTGPAPLSPTGQNTFFADDLSSSSQTETETMDLRVAYTLDALRDLARATASLPGRKNVIWLTTGFPIKMDEPNRRLAEAQLIRERDYSDQIRKAAAMLASMQIALYPVDVNGLLADAARGPTREALLNQRDTLVALAEETGGRAYYDRNDLDEEIARVLTTDSNYYTLAYSPRIKWDGSYHKVNVKMVAKDVEVTYRRGYYALGDSPLTEQQASRVLGEVLGLDVINSRMIVLAAQISRPEASSQQVQIECNIDPSTLVLDETAQGTKSAALAIGATVWDAHKRKVADVAKRVHPVLTSDELAVARTSGVPWALNVVVGPGTYTLKVAVVDLKSGKTGSLSIPLEVNGPKR